MKPSEDLFELVHSMTKAERKHFTQHANQYGAEGQTQKYLLLYKAVASQKQHDEAQLQKAVKGFITEKSFPSWKRHLLEALERSIREFHAGRDSAERVHEMLREAELLAQRGMWARSIRKTADCKKIALRMQDFLSLMRINGIERRQALEFDKQKMRERIEELISEWKDYSTKLDEEQAFAQIFDRLCTIIRRNFDPRDPKMEEELAPFHGEPLLHHGVRPFSFWAGCCYRQSRAFYFHLSERVQEEYQAYLDLIQFWEANSYFKSLRRKAYKLALTNYLHSAFKMSRHEEIPEVLDKMALIPAENYNEQAEDFQTRELYRLLYAYNKRQYHEATAMIPQIEQGLVTYKAKVNEARWLAFKTNFMIFFFLTGRFTEALGQVKQVLERPRSEHRKDLQALVRLFEPLLYFEVAKTDKEVESVRHNVHALREWLHYHQRDHEFELLVLKHLQKLTNAIESEKQACFQAAHADFLGLESKTEVSPFGLYELILWTGARAEGRTLHASAFEPNSKSDSASPT